MANRHSTLYLNTHVNFYQRDARDVRGRIHSIPFEHTVVSGEVSTDTVNLCVLPANCEVENMFFQTDGVGGTNTTGEIGDSGDANRFMLALDINTELTVVPLMPFTGWRFRPTSDTIVVLTWGASNPVAGNIVRGYFIVVPGV